MLSIQSFDSQLIGSFFFPKIFCLIGVKFLDLLAVGEVKVGEHSVAGYRPIAPKVAASSPRLRASLRVVGVASLHESHLLFWIVSH